MSYIDTKASKLAYVETECKFALSSPELLKKGAFLTSMKLDFDHDKYKCDHHKFHLT